MHSLQPKEFYTNMLVDFDVRGQQGMDFLARRNSLKLKYLTDGCFLRNMQLFTSQYVNWWTYLWIIMMFLSAVWTLILTAPIHSKGSTGEQVT